MTAARVCAVTCRNWRLPTQPKDEVGATDVLGVQPDAVAAERPVTDDNLTARRMRWPNRVLGVRVMGHVSFGVAMARRESYSNGRLAATIKGDQHDRLGCISPPTLEEGHRLIRAFLSIREAALREAVVDFVEELSTLQDEGQ